MTLSRALTALATAVLAVASLSCGGGTPTVPVPPTPTPAPTPAPTPTPLVLAHCGDLAPGPVVRYAIAPRAERINGQEVPMRVWVRGPWQEAWCLDKDKDHQIDFNSNQRNAEGKECCFVNDPTWKVAEDPDHITVGGGTFGDHEFNFRIGVEPRGIATSFGIQAELDGIKSKPWQSGPSVGYPEGPLMVVTLSAEDIEKYCKCTYFGNGNYNPECTDR